MLLKAVVTCLVMCGFALLVWCSVSHWDVECPPVSTSFPALLLTGPLQVFLEWKIYCGLVNFLWLHFSGPLMACCVLYQSGSNQPLTFSQAVPWGRLTHTLTSWKSYTERTLSCLINPCGPDSMIYCMSGIGLLWNQWPYQTSEVCHLKHTTCYKWSVKADLYCIIIPSQSSSQFWTPIES